MQADLRSKPFKCTVVALALCGALSPFPGLAQNASPQGPLPQASPASLHDTLLVKATSLYYSTAKAGLRSFDCQVHPDWPRMLKTARNGSAPADDDPKLALLKTVSITLNADLRGASRLDWQLPDHMPKPLDESQTALLNQVHRGIEQTLSGILKMWTPLVNGSIAETLGEESAHLSEDANGYTLRTNDPQQSVIGVFDRDLILKQFDEINSADSNVGLRPTYLATPQGLLPVSFIADIREPGANSKSPARQMDVSLEYQQVSSIQILSRITVAMPNVVEMDFKLDGCRVNPR